MKHWTALFLILIGGLLTACGTPTPVCTPGSVTYPGALTPFPTAPAPGGPTPTPAQVDIGGRTLTVDQVIHGPLCNARLSGVVYIACDVQVREWSEEPDFLAGCDFTVEPGTVIYVAAHNDTA